jgi:hypothetical protein
MGCSDGGPAEIRTKRGGGNTMNSLELKAKTGEFDIKFVNDLIAEAHKLEVENLQLKTDNEKLKQVFNNASELIIQSSTIIGNNKHWLKTHLQKKYDETQPCRNTESEVKIIKANKILDEINFKSGVIDTLKDRDILECLHEILNQKETKE